MKYTTKDTCTSHNKLIDLVGHSALTDNINFQLRRQMMLNYSMESTNLHALGIPSSQ